MTFNFIILHSEFSIYYAFYIFYCAGVNFGANPSHVNSEQDPSNQDGTEEEIVMNHMVQVHLPMETGSLEAETET